MRSENARAESTISEEERTTWDALQGRCRGLLFMLECPETASLPSVLQSGLCGMPLNAKKLVKFQAGMRKRIIELRARTEDCLECAMDSMMQDRVDSYFRVEEGLGEIDRSLGLIEEELPHIIDLSSAQRLDSR